MSMRKHVLAALLSLTLLLPGCAPAEGERDRLTVVCTTYPIYLFASSITQGVEGVAVERLDTGPVSCLHDYSLSMEDMKKLERADVIALNGAELEEFLEDALETSDAAVIDCSAGVELLEGLSHHHDGDEHDDHGHWDPHYWMDPANARTMAANLRNSLVLLDPDHAAEYENNAVKTRKILLQVEETAQELLEQYLPQGGPGLITFHDGFQYFARAFDLPLLAAIEEEAGAMMACPLFAYDPIQNYEMFWIRFAPGCRHASSAHDQGVVELVSVIAGTLQIELPERTVIVHPGEAARFSADVEHTYENIGDTDCEVYDQIFY